MAYKEYDEREMGFEDEPGLYGQDEYEGLGTDTFGERIEGDRNTERDDEALTDEDMADDTPASGNAKDPDQKPDRDTEH